MLMADNYFIGVNHRALDEVREIEKEYIIENFYTNSDPDDCSVCQNLNLKFSLLYAFSEQDYCPSCGKRLNQKKELQIINNWLEIPFLSKGNSLVNA